MTDNMCGNCFWFWPIRKPKPNSIETRKLCSGTCCCSQESVPVKGKYPACENWREYECVEAEDEYMCWK